MENFKMLMFIDGSEDTPLEFQTAGDRAGFGLFIHQNDGGLHLPGFTIEGRAEDNDTLVIEVRNANGHVVASSRTRRSREE